MLPEIDLTYGLGREYLTVSDISTITGIDGATVRKALVDHAKQDKWADIHFPTKADPLIKVPITTCMAAFGIFPSDFRALATRVQETRDTYAKNRINVPETIPVPEEIAIFAIQRIAELREMDGSPNLLGYDRPVPTGKLFFKGEPLKFVKTLQRVGSQVEPIISIPSEGWLLFLTWIHEGKKMKVQNINTLVKYAIETAYD